MSENILLMRDGFSGHWAKGVRDYAGSINVVLLKIPAGYTSVCQPADMTLMKPLKQRLRDRWASSMEEQLCAHRRSDVPTSFKLLAPKRRIMIGWLHSSLAELSTKTISSGFKKLMIASSADEAVCQEEPAPQGNVITLVATLTELNVAEDAGYDLEEASDTEE